MLIQNKNKTKEIEFTVLESLKDQHSSIRLGMRIKTEEIEAKFDRNTWVTNTEIQVFIEDIESLERTRNGQAFLKSMSPGEFHLGFRNSDNLGHITVEIMISKNSFQFGYSDHLRIEFELDPTSLPSIIAQLADLKTAD